MDTHALLWWLRDDVSLSAKAEEAIVAAEEVFVSAAAIWEIAIKYRNGKLPSAGPFIADLESIVLGQGFIGLPITLYHGHRAGLLEPLHRDPFDRVLIAQALAEDLTLVSNERLFDRYGASRLW